eukprot:2408884-Amphidinium_carterae.1
MQCKSKEGKSFAIRRILSSCLQALEQCHKPCCHNFSCRSDVPERKSSELFNQKPITPTTSIRLCCLQEAFGQPTSTWGRCLHGTI